jgi:hypothetical protein
MNSKQDNFKAIYGFNKPNEQFWDAVVNMASTLYITSLSSLRVAQTKYATLCGQGMIYCRSVHIIPGSAWECVFNQTSWILFMVAIELPGLGSRIEINQVNHRINSKLNA